MARNISAASADPSYLGGRGKGPGHSYCASERTSLAPSEWRSACHPGRMSAAGFSRSRFRPTLDLSVMIRRPASEAFALLADIQEAEPLPRRAVVGMEKDPAGQTAVARVGTRR